MSGQRHLLRRAVRRGGDHDRDQLARFNITGIAPIGNGLALSFGRFDTPFGYERHDAALNLTATLSEVNRFGRPMSMTGFQAAYQFTPWLDATAWVVNRWENETTEDPLEDNNRDKSFGGRVGFTPLSGAQLLNFGVGGWWGPEQDDTTRLDRWILDLDVTWTPLPRLLLAGEAVYGSDSGVSFRRRGTPIAAPAVNNQDVNWLGLYALVHYDLTRWLGLSFRYGFFDDPDAARTGVAQTLQSFTIAPIVHVSRLIPDLRPMGVTYARTRHPLDWVDVAARGQLLECRWKEAQQMNGIYLSRLPWSGKVFCTLYLLGIGCGALAAFTQAATPSVSLLPRCRPAWRRRCR